MNIPSKLPDGQKKPFVNNEFGVLRRVALCRPDHYDWAAENAIVAQARLRGKQMDRAAAIAQHGELRAALEGAGVDCVMLAPDPHLPMQTFTRDSGVMTPWGLLICQMARARTARRTGRRDRHSDGCGPAGVETGHRRIAGGRRRPNSATRRGDHRH